MTCLGFLWKRATAVTKGVTRRARTRYGNLGHKALNPIPTVPHTLPRSGLLEPSVERERALTPVQYAKYNAPAALTQTFFDSPRLHVNQDLEKVILTRRRWDAYMLPLFLAAAAIGILQIWQTGQLRFALNPIVVVPIWLMLRLQTPREGMQVTTIRSTPGTVVLLWFMAATLISMALLLAFDVYIIGHPFHAPLEPYHAALFAPSFIIMFTGVFWADRISREKKAKSCTHNGEKHSALNNNRQ